MTQLILPHAARVQIETAASAAWPRECCGLLEGMRVGGAVVVSEAHAMRNVTDAADAFEIDPAGHIALLRALRGTGREVVGCFHSHPNGRPEPSELDRAGAGEAGFVWLIAALAAPDAATLKAFRFDGGGFAPVSIIETASLDPARRPRV
jgi:proteasome lid subunit RPN8/RPN11